MSNPIIMHVNYCEQGQTIREICKKAARWGFDGVEFRRQRAKAEETRDEYLDAVAANAERYELRYVLFGGPGVNLMTQDAAVRRREIDDYKDFLDRAAHRLTLGVINFFTGSLTDPDAMMRDDTYHLHGSAIAQDWHWEAAAEGCREIGEYGAQYGVRFAFETHMNYLHDTAAAAKRLVDMIALPNFGINLDYGNGVYFKDALPITETIDLCGDKLFYLHLKNSVLLPRGGRMPTALCDGEINHRIYLKKLIETGYRGPICIEAPRPGDREWYAVQDIDYLKTLLRQCR